jgi:hypothetical protein
MPNHIDVRGASGTFYRFRPAEDPRARSTMSGNFVYVREDDGEVVFLGETDNLMIGAETRWREAQTAYGATGIFVRPIVARATRAEEQEDILLAGTPPMNDPLPTRAKPREQADSPEAGSLV